MGGGEGVGLGGGVGLAVANTGGNKQGVFSMDLKLSQHVTVSWCVNGQQPCRAVEE